MVSSKSCKQKLYVEAAVSRKTSPPSIPLPKNWTGHVKSAMLHVIALAHYAITYSRGWAADSINTRCSRPAVLWWTGGQYSSDEHVALGMLCRREEVKCHGQTQPSNQFLLHIARGLDAVEAFDGRHRLCRRT